MLQNLFYISSVIVLITGFLITFAIISNKYYQNILRQVNLIIESFEIKDLKPNKINPIYVLLKRIFDLIFAVTNLILLTPLISLIIIFIKMDSKGPVIVKFKRIGKGGKLFYAYKFRTMFINEDISSNNILKSGDPRITRIGKFLRRTALDELPEFINIITGSMSVVGTTIAREFVYEQMSEEYKNILKQYKPGFTNLWVVSEDREKFNYDRRLIYDLYYINNISLKLDFIIIIRTIIVSFGATASY